ncbi:tetratricopeptide repeat protein [Candidatus Bipolaricaulota bacterium]|nr:tetratricopeptide repeat protein [Candidatus Bipolaricaulota bacterium]
MRVAEEVEMITHKATELESLIESDVDLYSQYHIVKEKAAEIIKWSPPVDPGVPELPPYYTDHGMEHSKRILAILDRLTERLNIQIFEAFPLLCSVWLHDIGMFVGREPGEPYETTRKLHHLRTVEYVKQESEADRLPLDQWQLPNVLDICRAHRSRVNFDDEPIIPEGRPFEDGTGIVRVRLLASLLRFADVCDVRHTRAPQTVFEIHEEFIPRVSREHWKKHFRVGQVRFNWDRTCVEVPIILPMDDVEKLNEQRRIAGYIREELYTELQTVQHIFDKYGIGIFHVNIIDYLRGEYLDLSHVDDRDTLGWTIAPFAVESTTPDLDVLILQPLLAQEQVEQCYVEIPIVKELMQEIEKQDLSGNYLFCSPPRTGKTSLLAYLSTQAQKRDFNVLWFARQSNVPTSQELIRKLSARASLEAGTILVFDNIHEDERMLTLIGGLIKQKPEVTIWCASRISEFENLREKWGEVKDSFIERQVPGYLDRDSIMLFLDRYRELIDGETEYLILNQGNVTAYYLVDIYRQLKRNDELEREEEKLPSSDIVAQVSIDMEEDNRRTFGSLNDIERLALKIISYLDTTPRLLLEHLLQRSDLQKSKGVIESLLARRVAFPGEQVILTPKRTELETVRIFDSFEEFIVEQMYELDTRTVIPGLLLAEARDCQNEIPLALLALMDKYNSLNSEQRDQMRAIIKAQKQNPVALWVASYLAGEDPNLLELADLALESTVQIESVTLAFFGHAFSQHGEHTRATTFLERTLEMEPNQALWLHEVAHSYQALGNLELAVERMKEAADNNPRYLDCLGDIFRQLGEKEKALESYHKAIEYDYNNAKAWNNAGYIYFARGNLSKAREYCETALKIDPEFIWSIKGLAVISVRLEDFEKAIELFLKILSIEKGDEETWSRLADCYDELGRYQEAIQALEQAAGLNSEEAGYYYDLGLLWNKLDEFDKTIFYYSQVIDKDPEFVEAYVNRGTAYFNKRADYTTARKNFETAVSIQPSHSLAHVCLGNALRELGELERAQKEYEIALELDPGKEPQAHVHAREELESLKARKVIDLVKQGHSPDLQQCKDLSAKSLNTIAYDMLMAEGRLDKVAAIVKIGLEQDPSYGYLYATKGLLHFRQGDIEQGRALYKQAISMSPDDLPLQQKFHYEYGIALRIQGKFKKAIYEFECAQKIAAEYVPKEQIEAEMRKAQQGDNSK